eukprot:scaffold878_cov271-Pinguiococcus_pyrenoidosus.AAC.48
MVRGRCKRPLVRGFAEPGTALPPALGSRSVTFGRQTTGGVSGPAQQGELLTAKAATPRPIPWLWPRPLVAADPAVSLALSRARRAPPWRPTCGRRPDSREMWGTTARYPCRR